MQHACGKNRKIKIRENKLWRYGLALLPVKRIEKNEMEKANGGAVRDWAT
jgi:hypothetical protein